MVDGETGTILGYAPIDILAVQPGMNEVTLNGLV
jgi:hypothetical protein